MKKNVFFVLFFMLLSLACSYFGYLVERDFGRIEVSTVSFMTEEQQPMIAKLYRPNTASVTTPKPALLALHGYQSDKEATNTFGALELAKRGFVVLAIDHFGHGYSTKLPAANKNMSGANNGYQYLKTLDFVDKNNLGIFGHSTGALNAIRVAKLNPDHKAINGLSSNGGSPELHNYLLTQGLYEEIGGYREKSFPVKDLVRNPTRLQAFSLAETEELQWNHLYGDFTNGSARQATLVNGTHLGVMIAKESNKAAILWFNQTLQQGQKGEDWINPDDQTYWYKEFSGLFALAFALVSALFLASFMLQNKFFSNICQPVTNKIAISNKTWWKFAVINILITIFSYPIFTQWGGANEPIAAKLSFMPLEMGNGIISWLMASAVISAIFFFTWKRTSNINLSEFGLLQTSSTFRLINRNLILALILVAWLYLITIISQALFNAELRFLWPLLKTLTLERWQLFLVYWLPILVFFMLFNGLIISIQMKQSLTNSFAQTLLSWTIKSCIFATGGLIILWLFHFVPDFMQIGPGFDLIGLPQFGGRWMMMLAVIIPQFIVFTFLNHWCFLKTGYVYLGVFFTSLLMTWVLVGGQVIGRFLA